MSTPVSVLVLPDTEESLATVLTDLRERWGDITPIQIGNQEELAAALSGFEQTRREKARVEEALSLSEERLRLAMEAAGLVTWDWKMSTGLLSWFGRRESPSGFQTKTLPAERAVLLQHIHPEDRERISCELERVLRPGAETNDLSLEHRILRPDGTIRWMLQMGRVHRDADGRPVRVIGTAMDITDRRTAEETLRQSEARYRSVIHQVKDVIFQTDARGCWTFLNAAWTEILGFSVEDSLGKSCQDFIHPGERERCRELVGPLLSGERDNARLEVRCRTAEGAVRWIEVFVRLIQDENGQLLGASGILRDVNERKLAEEHLLQNQIRLTLLNGISAGIVNRMSTDQIIERTLREIHRHFSDLRVTYCTIDGTDRVHIHYAVAPVGMPCFAGVMLDLGPARELLDLIRAGTPLVADDVSTEPLLAPLAERLVDAGVQAVLAMPLRHSKRLLGQLCFKASSPRRWSEHEITTLWEISQYLGIAIQDAQAHHERNQALEALRDSELRLRSIFDSAVDAIVVVDEAGRVESFNPAAERLFGYTPLEVLGRHVVMLAGQSSKDWQLRRLLEEVRAVRGRPINVRGEYLGRRKDGSDFPLELTISLMPLGGCFRYLAIVRDITARRREEEAQASERSLLEMIASNRSLTEILDFLSRFVEAQAPRLKVSIQLLELEPFPLVPPPGERKAESPEAEPAEGGGEEGEGAQRLPGRGTRSLEPRLPALRQASRLKQLEGFSTPILSRSGQMLGLCTLSCSGAGLDEFEQRLVEKAVYIAGIAIERAHAEQYIHRLAHHDGLTGLPNRNLLYDRIAQAVAQARRSQDRVGLIFLDLDRFKNVNDSLGHQVGDELLKALSERLCPCVRREDTVARIGGDEFVVVLPCLPDAMVAGQIARKLLDALAAPFQVGGHELHVEASIGIGIYPDDGTDVESLMKSADIAMYHAKEKGRNNFQFFTAEMNAIAQRRLTMENNLRRALRWKEFILHYQPQICGETGRMIGVEALIRWNHPAQGLVPPGHFIPIAEDSGLIVPIGEWALREACVQNRSWQEAGLAPMRMSVNLSARQFRHQDLAAVVRRILEETGHPAELLELELTESILMHGSEETVGTLREIAAMGVHLSIDDFGTGYSSLSYLKRFPIERLKIDRSFVQDITVNADDAAIATAIIAMAKSLNLHVIAEGVETADQLELLRRLGCREFQGYFFSRPLPPDGIVQMLGSSRKAAGG